MKLPENITLTTPKYGGVYHKSEESNEDFCIYRCQEETEVKQPYFTLVPKDCVIKENFLFNLAIVSEEKTANICYKNGDFLKLDTDHLASEYT